MVTHTLENSRVGKQVMPRILTVDSRRGKQIRAEPVVALYEKNVTIRDDGTITRNPQPRIIHVGQQGGDLTLLEDEQTTWVPADEGNSPNRVDALVHGVTELVGDDDGDVEFATPVDLPSSHVGTGLYLPEHFAMQQETVNPYGLYIP
jgi:hypothetical protein